MRSRDFSVIAGAENVSKMRTKKKKKKRNRLVKEPKVRRAWLRWRYKLERGGTGKEKHFYRASTLGELSWEDRRTLGNSMRELGPFNASTLYICN